MNTTLYAFFVKRPIDSEPWPLIFTSEQRATEYPDRCSEVVPVGFGPGATHYESLKSAKAVGMAIGFSLGAGFVLLLMVLL